MLYEPLVVIVGETASGKSALAMELAQRFSGEIICADSRTIYKNMDIGTAKPTKADQAVVPHHLLDVVEPDEAFTVADFQRLANQAIMHIYKKGRLPILVGGSGLYVDAVLFNYQFSGTEAPRDELNTRHVKNAEQTDRQTMRAHTLVVGLEVERVELKKRVSERLEKMLAAGLENEAQQLVRQFGWDVEPLKTIGYREFRPYFEGQETLEQAKLAIIKDTMAYAKRQRTWFKRNSGIHWLKEQSEAVDLVTTFLNK